MERGNSALGFRAAYISKDVGKMAIKLIIMIKIKKGITYPYAILKELEGSHIAEAHGLAIGDLKNDVYNTIKALQKEGYIEEVAGTGYSKTRKGYRLTRKGHSALREVKRAWKRAFNDIKQVIG